MSETTPDPADVHTGTDRVELAKLYLIRNSKTGESIRFDKANEIMGRLEPLIESMLAARQEGKP